MMTINATSLLEKFLEKTETALSDDTFVRITLGAYHGAEPDLVKIQVRKVELKGGIHLQFCHQFKTREVVKNSELGVAKDALRTCIESGFRSARLFTTVGDWQLDPARDGTLRLNRGPATFKEAPVIAHDREKARLIDPSSLWLQTLGVMDAQGRVREKMRAKWTQINSFLEVLESHLNASCLSDATAIRLADMGCGKGYLTFAAYAYLKQTRGVAATVLGVEMREELVTAGNNLAKECGFEGLSFVKGYIQQVPISEIDILVALHACNTATDDALHAGISAGTEIILCSPCCHQEIRPQLIAPEVLSGVLKHGILAERMAELLTDGMRAMLMEQAGYTTKVMEFVPDEHTPKNLLLTGIRKPSALPNQSLADSYLALKNFFGLKSHHLETLLSADQNTEERRPDEV